MGRLVQPQIIGPIRVEALANGGAGIIRSDGRVIFVPQVVPEDEILCRIGREKKRYAEAELLEVLTPSPLRRELPCPVADRCGGCQWQQLTYAGQLHWKEQLFRETLVRQCGVDPARLKPIVAAPEEWNYRSRVQIKCRVTAAGFVCGFFQPKSHFVVPISSCPVLAEPLNELLADLHGLIVDSAYAEQIPQLDLALADCQRRQAVVHYLGTDILGLTELLRRLKGLNALDLFLRTGRKNSLRKVCGQDELILEVDQPPLQLGYKVGGFAQINLAQNRQLVSAVIEAAALTGREQLLDLYCGMGNFSLPLARHAKQVIGVEDYAPAIAAAVSNASRNQIANVDFHARRAEGALAAFSKKASIDLLVLDPPRAGAYEVMAELVQLPVPRILYVSCDPQTLARDLKPLLAGGYRLVSSQPFDMFPQTYHVESLTCLEYCGQ